MSKILYDWQCSSCNLKFEAMAKSDIYQIPCPDCEATARRVILRAPRIDMLAMAQGENAPPGAVDYFERVHKQQRVIEERSEMEHGDYGPRPGAD